MLWEFIVEGELVVLVPLGAELGEQHGLEDMNRRWCCSLSERKQVGKA